VGDRSFAITLGAVAGASGMSKFSWEEEAEQVEDADHFGKSPDCCGLTARL
jgi:hypothetical protein